MLILLISISHFNYIILKVFFFFTRHKKKCFRHCVESSHQPLVSHLSEFTDILLVPRHLGTDSEAGGEVGLKGYWKKLNGGRTFMLDPQTQTSLFQHLISEASFVII